jgi:hypothetical protein
MSLIFWGAFGAFARLLTSVGPSWRRIVSTASTELADWPPAARCHRGGKKEPCGVVGYV